MMIVCPHCATSYRVEINTLGNAGRTVRCVRCRTVWFAQQEAEPSAEKHHAERLASQLVSAADALASPIPDAPAPDHYTPDNAPVPFAADDVYALENEPAAAMESAPAEFNQPYSETADFDSQPEPIDPSPSIVPPMEQLAALPTTLPDPNAEDDGESFVARRELLHQRRKKQRFAMPSSPVMILMFVAIIAGLIGWRKTVVQFAPQTASLYARIGLPVNLRGVVFDSVKTMRDTHDGIPVLVVEGSIGSHSPVPVDIPRLRFAVRNAAGMEIYSWTAVPGRNVLAPGEQLPFKSRLASPPAEAQDVTVRFFNRQDVVAGVR